MIRRKISNTSRACFPDRTPDDVGEGRTVYARATPNRTFDDEPVVVALTLPPFQPRFLPDWSIVLPRIDEA